MLFECFQADTQPVAYLKAVFMMKINPTSQVFKTCMVGLISPQRYWSEKKESDFRLMFPKHVFYH